MMTVEQYIEQRKKKDKLNEFDFKNHAENMSAVMKYVMEYFNIYLNPEECDYENVKLEQTLAKVEKEIGSRFPKSISFIIGYYRKHRSRIDKVFGNWFKSQEYMELFYCQDDYEKSIEAFCDKQSIPGVDWSEYKNDLIKLAEEIKRNETEKPSIDRAKYLDNALISWVRNTYAEYRVNLFEFASKVTYEYYEKHIERVYDRSAEQFYYINRYNHRYNENPFGVDLIYKENSHRPFLYERRGELEMLLMHEWVFQDVEDEEYWPEYVNLCISTGRIKLVQKINVLVPVISRGVLYPKDVKSEIELFETTNGLLKNQPSGNYIVRVSYSKDDDVIWKDNTKLEFVLNNLQETFKVYGAPYAVEWLSPLRAAAYNEKEFFTKFSLIEKQLKKYPNTMITLLNGGARSSGKQPFLFRTADDAIKIRNIAKEMKLRLKIVIDFSKMLKNKEYQRESRMVFSQLHEIRNSIMGIHLSNSFPTERLSGLIRADDKIYLNQFEYPKLSEFLGGMSSLFSDNQQRYFVPEDINNERSLEDLVDSLLRSGFTFLEAKE